MSQNKIVILGVDALEYDLVEEWDLQIYKQKSYGKIEVPILEKHEEPSTPVVWASFITGEEPKITEVTRFKDWDNPILPLLDRMAIKLGITIKTRKKVGDFFSKIGFKKKPPTKDRYQKIGTIFSDIPNSKAISVPSYNEDEEVFEIRRAVIFAFDNENEKKLIAEKIYMMDVEKVNELITSLHENTLLMAHLFTLDVVQHLYFKKPEVIHTYYDKMSELVTKVKEKLEKSDHLLIVSDHGQKKGLHTPYGFYSANKNLKVNSILEFREFIKKLSKM